MATEVSRDVAVESSEQDVRSEEHRRAYRARYWMAAIRLSIGWVFLWAFLDKTFGLGFATESADAWVRGGSPTFGYLEFGTEGKWFHEFFSSLTGTFSDWLFMIGLLGIGLALILGIGMWIAAISGSVLLMLMWAAALPLVNNPFMDDHVVYSLALIAMAIYGAGRYWGLGRWWERQDVVQRFPVLK